MSVFTNRTSRSTPPRGFRICTPPPADSTLPNHHGNITQMDEAFGRLMRVLDDLELRESTVVFFTSDNGPAITSRHPHGSAGPLRDKKGAVYEGGIRVPGIVRWPGHTTAGSVSDEPVCGVDLLPTLCGLADVAVPDDRTIDGASFAPVLSGGRIKRSRPLYWQYNRARSEPKVAMRLGDWKILARLTGPQLKPGADLAESEMRAMKSAELTGFELYNVADDPAESSELSNAYPERLDELRKSLQTAYADVVDESPVWPEWKWPRYEGRIIRGYYEALRAASEQ